jgi:hypothetical protein
MSLDILRQAQDAAREPALSALKLKVTERAGGHIGPPLREDIFGKEFVGEDGGESQPAWQIL